MGDSQGEAVTNRPAQNSETACVIKRVSPKGAPLLRLLFSINKEAYAYLMYGVCGNFAKIETYWDIFSRCILVITFSDETFLSSVALCSQTLAAVHAAMFSCACCIVGTDVFCSRPLTFQNIQHGGDGGRFSATLYFCINGESA